MKKLIVSLVVVMISASGALFAKSVPNRDTRSDTSALAVKIVSDEYMPFVYFQSGSKKFKATRIGDYYVLFNVKPGTYHLTNSSTLNERHIFPSDMQSQVSATLGKGEFAFLGSYSVATNSESIAYDFNAMDDSPASIANMAPFDGIQQATFYYNEKDSENDSATRQQFISSMSDKLKGTGWDDALKAGSAGSGK